MLRARLTIVMLLSICFLAIAYSTRPDRAKRTNQQTTGFSKSSAEATGAQGLLALESFENEFPPSGWSRITSFGGFGWQQIHNGDDVAGFQSPAPATVPSGGGDAVAFASWATGDADGDPGTGQPTEQFLITPQIANIDTSDTLRFHLRYFSRFGDSLDVLISPTIATEKDSFNILVDQISFIGLANNTWQTYEYPLRNWISAGSDIYIAFREHVQNTSVEGDALLLDLVEVRSLITGVADAETAPNTLQLQQNYPNPFNPSTSIPFDLPARSRVTLTVYNVLGQSVAALLDGAFLRAGRHQVRFDASHLPNGIYYYRLTAGHFAATGKMALLK